MFKTLGLTGKTRYRTNWRGKLILQVEYKKQYIDNSYQASFSGSHPDDFKIFNGYWRDAKLKDIEIEATINETSIIKEHKND